MRALALPFLVALLAVSVPARAEFLLGVMGNSGLNGINTEWVGEGGSVWLLVGAYQASTGLELENLTGMLGFRRFQGGSFSSGFFGGGFIGDVDGGTRDAKFGGGGEVGYQWVTQDLRMTLQTGVALVDDSGPGSSEQGIKPVSIVGASVSLRL